MKLIHTGDIHIGSALKNLPADKAKLRKAELIDGFAKICAYAKANGVFAVLIAGDLFDDAGVPAHVIRQVFSVLENAKPVRFFYVSGNHDKGLGVMQDAPDNVYGFSHTPPFASYDLGENVTLTGMDAGFFSLENFSALRFSPSTYNVLLLHGDVAGDTRAKEHIPLAYLQNKNVDYLALGHIHKPTLSLERFDARGHYRYCGTPESRGFDEIGERGFFLLEIVNGKLTDEKFLSLATRAVREIKVDISHCKDYFDLERAVLAQTKTFPQTDCVKCVLCGSYQTALRKDLPLLQARLSQRFFYVKLQDESRLFFDPRAYANDLTERGEFVREVGKCEMNARLKEEILEVGLKALAGEEIDL